MANPRYKIILVDDNIASLTQGRNILKMFYEVFAAESAEKLFEILAYMRPDLIMLDIDMPVESGYEAIVRLKADARFADIPVIFVTAIDDPESEVKGFDLGAVDYVTKPFSAPMLMKRIEKELLIVRQKKELLDTQAELERHLENLEKLVEEKAAAVIRMQNAVLATVVDMVELRDKYTGGHITRTQRYLEVLIDEMRRENVYADELSRWDVQSVLSSAKLHDIGKIAVPDVILSKGDQLTEEEFATIKQHVTAGIDAIERIISKTEDGNLLEHAIHIAGTHHERWDGSGYPLGLNGLNIPLEGRLMAVADVYDALISRRQYKDAFSHEEACRIIEESSGTQFDPAIVSVFRAVEDEFARIAREVNG